MMTDALLNSYPTGEHLEGNFVQYYLTNFVQFDRYIVKLFGERCIYVDKDEELADTIIDWTQDINSIVFAHLIDWAKMYSASIKDYEPLWNVDGTEVTTYGEKNREEDFAIRRNEDIIANRHNEVIIANRHAEDVLPNYSDNQRKYAASYPDSTEVFTERNQNEYGAHTNQHNETGYTDQSNETGYTDAHTQGAHLDKFKDKEHVDTLRRTGNIGVTKSTELIESEYQLRERWNFYRLIFGYMLKEMGVHYDEGNRCFHFPRIY